MVYFVYRDKEYFGYTYSKNVVKKLKKISSSYQSFQTYRVCEDDLRLDDEYQITVYTLFDKMNQPVDVITTDKEIYNAKRWLVELLQTYILDPVADLYFTQTFDYIQTRLIPILSNYMDIIGGVFLLEREMDIEDMTYEGFVLYQHRKEGIGLV